MDASLVAWAGFGFTVLVTVIGWVLTLHQSANKTTAAINTVATECANKIVELSKELWKAINDNTRQVEQLIGKVDRDLSHNRGEFMQQVEQNRGRISTLETVFKMGQARREAYDAAEYLHKPEAAAVEVDALIDEFKAKINKVAPMTLEREAEFEQGLIKHIESVLPDTGQRRMLKAKYAMTDDQTAMPREPPDKAPDQPKPTHPDST